MPKSITTTQPECKKKFQETIQRIVNLYDEFSTKLFAAKNENRKIRVAEFQEYYKNFKHEVDLLNEYLKNLPVDGDLKNFIFILNEYIGRVYIIDYFQNFSTLPISDKQVLVTDEDLRLAGREIYNFLRGNEQAISEHLIAQNIIKNFEYRMHLLQANLVYLKTNNYLADDKELWPKLIKDAVSICLKLIKSLDNKKNEKIAGYFEIIKAQFTIVHENLATNDAYSFFANLSAKINETLFENPEIKVELLSIIVFETSKTTVHPLIAIDVPVVDTKNKFSFDKLNLEHLYADLMACFPSEINYPPFLGLHLSNADKVIQIEYENLQSETSTSIAPVVAAAKSDDELDKPTLVYNYISILNLIYSIICTLSTVVKPPSDVLLTFLKSVKQNLIELKKLYSHEQKFHLSDNDYLFTEKWLQYTSNVVMLNHLLQFGWSEEFCRIDGTKFDRNNVAELNQYIYESCKNTLFELVTISSLEIYIPFDIIFACLVDVLIKSVSTKNSFKEDAELFRDLLDWYEIILNANQKCELIFQQMTFFKFACVYIEKICDVFPSSSKKYKFLFDLDKFIANSKIPDSFKFEFKEIILQTEKKIAKKDIDNAQKIIARRQHKDIAKSATSTINQTFEQTPEQIQAALDPPVSKKKKRQHKKPLKAVAENSSSEENNENQDGKPKPSSSDFTCSSTGQATDAKAPEILCKPIEPPVVQTAAAPQVLTAAAEVPEILTVQNEHPIVQTASAEIPDTSSELKNQQAVQTYAAKTGPNKRERSNIAREKEFAQSYYPIAIDFSEYTYDDISPIDPNFKSILNFAKEILKIDKNAKFYVKGGVLRKAAQIGAAAIIYDIDIEIVTTVDAKSKILDLINQPNYRFNKPVIIERREIYQYFPPEQKDGDTSFALPVDLVIRDNNEIDAADQSTKLPCCLINLLRMRIFETVILVPIIKFDMPLFQPLNVSSRDNYGELAKKNFIDIFNIIRLSFAHKMPFEQYEKLIIFLIDLNKPDKAQSLENYVKTINFDILKAILRKFFMRGKAYNFFTDPNNKVLLSGFLTLIKPFFPQFCSFFDDTTASTTTDPEKTRMQTFILKKLAELDEEFSDVITKKVVIDQGYCKILALVIFPTYHAKIMTTKFSSSPILEENLQNSALFDCFIALIPVEEIVSTKGSIDLQNYKSLKELATWLQKTSTDLTSNQTKLFNLLRDYRLNLPRRGNTTRLGIFEPSGGEPAAAQSGVAVKPSQIVSRDTASLSSELDSSSGELSPRQNS